MSSSFAKAVAIEYQAAYGSILRRLEKKQMDVRDLKALRDQLGEYVSLYADCIKTAPSRKHLHTYVNGQISDLERKNVEAIALDAGVPPRSLQEFLGIHCWDEGLMRTRVQQLVQDRHGDGAGIVPVDETSFQKKGNKTAGG